MRMQYEKDRTDAELLQGTLDMLILKVVAHLFKQRQRLAADRFDLSGFRTSVLDAADGFERS